ncbi:MAG: uracil-DNA glycosylase [Deltaproteobacteria bacterium]|nr:uracil-DNA glycosylase [Deltaproteobacteria bacterium]
MPEDPAVELRDLVDGLMEWLRYQQRLGVRGLPPEPAAAPTPESMTKSEKTPTLEEIRQEMGHCQRCKLYAGAKSLVFGEGSPTARLMFIGEAPGAEEDLQGRPFVGAAGQLLNNLLNKLGLEREEVYITNVVKSRPPGNRNPEPDEIEACLPFLKMQITAIKPRVIVALGKIATHALLGATEPITKIRGKWQRYDHIRVMPTFHPSYLLRFKQERIKTWEDMQKVMEYLAAE